MRDIEDIKRMNDEAVAKASVDKAIAAALKEGEMLAGLTDSLRRDFDDGVAAAFLKGYELALRAWQAGRPQEELRAYAAGFLISGVSRFAGNGEEADLFKRVELCLIGVIEAADRTLAKDAEQAPEVQQAA